MCNGEWLHEFYRIEECTGSVQMTQAGWSLQLRHRHYSGSWSKSCVDVFEALSLDELLEALEATVRAWDDRRHVADG